MYVTIYVKKALNNLQTSIHFLIALLRFINVINIYNLIK